MKYQNPEIGLRFFQPKYTGIKGETKENIISMLVVKTWRRECLSGAGLLRKGVLKICRQFKGKHSCRSAISIKLLCNVIEIALRRGCSPVNLLFIFRIPFLKNTSGWLFLVYVSILEEIWLQDAKNYRKYIRMNTDAFEVSARGQVMIFLKIFIM